MPQIVPWAEAAVLVFAVWVETQPLCSAAVDASSLQQQLDELRTGQQRLQRQVDELQRQLKEVQSSTATNAAAAPTPVFTLNVHGELFRGGSAAKIGLMEFSDFECSYCGKFARELYPGIERDYIKPGKIKYFFRDLPAQEHRHAMDAARAVRCAGDQGRFWEMHDLLFSAQAALEKTNLAFYAQSLGLDTSMFSQCLEDEGYAESIRASVAGAKQIGIHGTPAFVVGTLSEDGDFLRVGQILVGGDSDADLRSALDELLSNKPKPAKSLPDSATKDR